MRLTSSARPRTPLDSEAVSDDDLAGSTREARPPVPLLTVPWLAVTLEGLRSLPLDSRAAYVLSLVDGQCPVEVILDICDMDRDEVLAILAHLLELGAIQLRDP